MSSWIWRLKRPPPIPPARMWLRWCNGLEVEMKAAAKKLEFERAAELRNRIRALKLKVLELAP